MHLVKDFEDQVRKTSNTNGNLESALEDLRSLGDHVSRVNPEFFEKENFDNFMAEVRSLAKKL